MYVHNGIEKYLSSWIARGWRLANKKPVLNKDLWMTLNTLLPMCPHVVWQWVKAHSTSAHNNQVDKLARQKALLIQSQLPIWFVPPITIGVDTQKPLFF
jgi:ribonuclease HI